MIHGYLSMMGGFYCFVYADGEAHTTWFHSNYYKLTMFDVQKWLNLHTAGYLVMDLGIVLFSLEKGNWGSFQTYMHHVVGTAGVIMGNHIGGMLGSIS